MRSFNFKPSIYLPLWLTGQLRGHQRQSRLQWGQLPGREFIESLMNIASLLFQAQSGIIV
jgi:hypothetical protein